MVQILQPLPSTRTLRQQAFDESMGQIGQGLVGFAQAKDQKTQREQALQLSNEKSASDFISQKEKEGLLLSPEEEQFKNSIIQRALKKPETPQGGILSNIFGFGKGEEEKPEGQVAVQQASEQTPIAKQVEAPARQQVEQSPYGDLSRYTPKKQAEIRNAADKIELDRINLRKAQDEQNDVGKPFYETKKGAGEKDKFIDELRKEITSLPATKSLVEIDTSLSKIRSAPKTAAGDITRVFSFMKLNDPNSTVREGEYATAQNAAGVPERIRAAYNKALSGEGLTESQRGDFENAAVQLASSQLETYKSVTAPQRARIKSLGVNEEFIFPKFSQEQYINEAKQKSQQPPISQENKNVVHISAPIPKGKVRVSNGAESFEINESELAAAKKDGFKVIK